MVHVFWIQHCITTERPNLTDHHRQLGQTMEIDFTHLRRFALHAPRGHEQHASRRRLFAQAWRRPSRRVCARVGARRHHRVPSRERGAAEEGCFLEGFESFEPFIPSKTILSREKRREARYEYTGLTVGSVAMA